MTEQISRAKVGAVAPKVAPTLDNYGWQFYGACRGEDPEKFFLENNLRGKDKVKKISIAKSICRTCPVVRECLEFSIKAEVRYGIWGGLDEEQRAEILKKMAG